MRQTDLEHHLSKVMEPTFQGKGKWENTPIRKVLLSLIRKRPRDLIKLCTLAAREANQANSHLIRTKHFEDIFKLYSQGRVQDTVNEYRFELPEIERLILNMKPNKAERRTAQNYTYTTDQIISKINNLTEQGAFIFADNKKATSKQLLAFLYKTNFLTARKNTDIKPIRYYFEENRYLSNELADFGYDWEVHPAYRWALQPDDIMGIFNTLELSE